MSVNKKDNELYIYYIYGQEAPLVLPAFGLAGTLARSAGLLAFVGLVCQDAFGVLALFADAVDVLVAAEFLVAFASFVVVELLLLQLLLEEECLCVAVVDAGAVVLVSFGVEVA